ncbi:16S rRNA pseudouridine(516) synthase [Clostridium merdae]|uniref:16S rRNA pseudouridine(516) synthase n=1 Tax=Clostridium merdae TaxID=1958780 RepID=UPI000A26CDFA|nr:16S rRNA pseudouridine(516) synthase [Clostridium merdae]
MALERLDKILASQNIGSRKDVGYMIRKGRVTVNGVVVVKSEQKADVECDAIAVDGREIASSRMIYLMMNKPQGVLSASRDSRAKTVVDLVPQEWQRRGLFPAGRLDKDTVGLLILTNDGEYAHKMLSPKKKVEKIYEAVLDNPIDSEDILAFSVGVKMKDFDALPAKLSVMPHELADENTLPLERQVRVIIHEGKYHQVKRMFMARGKTVQALRRVQIGSLKLDPNLAPGEVRQMGEKEILAVFT